MITPALRRVVVGELDTNCWIVHAEGHREALVVDPGDEPQRILEAARDLDVVAVVLTHRHFDHVLAVPGIVDALGVPVLAHPSDAPVWPHELATLRRDGHWDAGTATGELLARDPAALSVGSGWDGATRPLPDVLQVGPLDVTVRHTPGHTPGGVSLVLPGHVLTGDTLFPGGPGLTGPPFSDFETIMDSVEGLLALPPDTRVHPGHGHDTTIGAERGHLDDWRIRGW